MNRVPNILIVDDDKIFQHVIEGILLSEEYKMIFADSIAEVIHLLKMNMKYEVVILDIMMNYDTEGVDILTEVKKMSPSTQVIMLTVIDDLELAVKLMSLGAFFYIVKDRLDIHLFRDKVAQAIRISRLEGKTKRTKKSEEYLLENFPSPIASKYNEYLKETSPAKKVRLLFSLFEVVITFITIGIICQYLKYRKKDFTNSLVNDILAPKYSIGKWLGILMRFNKLNKIPNEKYELILDQVFDNKTFIHITSSLAEAYKDISKYGTSKIARINNQYINQNEPLLKILLKQISYYWNYTLILVNKNIGRFHASYRFEGLEFYGYNKNPAKIIKEFIHFLNENELVFIEKLSESYLVVHPFIIYKMCDCCHSNQLFYFESITGNTTKYFCFRCNKSITLNEYNEEINKLFGVEK